MPQKFTPTQFNMQSSISGYIAWPPGHHSVSMHLFSIVAIIVLTFSFNLYIFNVYSFKGIINYLNYLYIFLSFFFHYLKWSNEHLYINFVLLLINLRLSTENLLKKRPSISKSSNEESFWQDTFQFNYMYSTQSEWRITRVFLTSLYHKMHLSRL